ncbi:MAG: S41 family peptidase [Thermotogota bacterium]
MKKVLVFSIVIVLIILFMGFAFDLIGITEHFGKEIFYIGDSDLAIQKHMEKEYSEIVEKYEKDYKNDRLSFFNFFVDSLEESYVFLNEKEKLQNFSFEEMKAFYKNKVSQTNNNQDFNYLIFELQSVLKDPNIRVSGIMKDIKTVPMNFSYKDGQLIIKSFNISYFLENFISFDIKEGLVLKTIDGEPAKDIFSKVKDITFYNNLNSQAFENIFFTTYYNYYRKGEDSSELVFSDGQNDYSMVVTYEDYEEYYNMGNFVTENRSDIKGMESKIIGDNIGYLKLDSFDFVSFQETLMKEMEKISLTDILIIDLRNISGENFSNIKYFLSFFEKNEIFGYSKQSVNHHLSVISNKYIKEDKDFTTLQTGNSKNEYKNEIVFIVDETHNNHKNLLISFFDSLEYTHFIGEEYTLHSSESLFIETPWKYSFLIPYLQYYDVEQNLIEGSQFEPDVIVPFVNTQIVGEDFYVETAFNYALTLIE